MKPASAPGEGPKPLRAKAGPESPAAMAGPLMEAIVERDNLKKALAQVKRNKGAPGRRRHERRQTWRAI